MQNISKNQTNDNLTAQEQAEQLQIYQRQKRTTSILLAIAAFLVALLLVFIFICSPAMVSGESMLPTLNDGQIIMISRLHKTPTIGDIVVYNKPTEKNKKVIKRVAGMEGDTFYFSFDTLGHGSIIREGSSARYSLSTEQRTFLLNSYGSQRMSSGPYDGCFYFTLKKGEIFTIGDNEHNSIDGRNYGPIQVKELLGIMI